MIGAFSNWCELKLVRTVGIADVAQMTYEQCSSIISITAIASASHL